MSRERGGALVGALLALTLAGAIAAALAEVSRLTIVQGRLREHATRAWLLAEAGLAETLAEVPPGRAFDDVLAHPTRRGGNGPWTWDSRLQAAPDQPEAIFVLVEARGPAPVRRRLLAHVARAREPFLPGALTAAGGVRELTRDFRLDGRNYLMADRCTTVVQTPTRAGLAVAEHATLPALAPDQVIGRGRTRRSTLPDLGLLAHAPGGVTYAAGPLAGTLGTDSAPRFTVVEGDAVITGAVAGTGLLYVDGRLTIRGSLDFVGVVAARNGLDVTGAAALDVCGAVWAAGDPAVAVRGSGTIRRSVAALEMAGRLAPLPARAEPVAIREYFGGRYG